MGARPREAESVGRGRGDAADQDGEAADRAEDPLVLESVALGVVAAIGRGLAEILRIRRPLGDREDLLQQLDDRRGVEMEEPEHDPAQGQRSEEHTSELQSLMRTSYAGV